MITQIAGIPCQIEVKRWYRQKPLGRDCDSDWDSDGYIDCEFDVLDRNGRRASWLEVKMTDADKERIINELEAYCAD
jgi:hypothetical protein